MVFGFVDQDNPGPGKEVSRDWSRRPVCMLELCRLLLFNEKKNIFEKSLKSF